MLRAGLRAWYALRLLELRHHPRPREGTSIRTSDPRADRVLVLGNGFTHGWGVATARDALAGRLSEALSDRTGRGCDVTVVGSEAMNVRSARAWLGDDDLTAVDALVLALGANDALRLTPVADWERGLTDLLGAVVPRLRPDAPVLVLGIPPVRALGVFDGVATPFGARHRHRLDAATRTIAEATGVAYLPVTHLADAQQEHPAPAVAYARLGTRIAGELAPALLAARPDADAREPLPDPRWDWSGTHEVVALAADGGAPVLRGLADSAQKRFKVELAAVTLVRGDRLYYAVNTDVAPDWVPLDLSFCRYPVSAGEPVIIPDVRADARFAGNPLVELSGINFYAGYPLRASDGTVIGSFCLQGSRVRPADAVSLAALGELALEAEAELRRFERAPRSAAVSPVGAPQT